MLIHDSLYENYPQYVYGAVLSVKATSIQRSPHATGEEWCLQPWQDPASSSGGLRRLTTVGNNGAANCAAYCAYNWGNEVTAQYPDATGACCVTSHKSNQPNTPIGCTANNPGVLGGGKTLNCICQVDDRPFLPNFQITGVANQYNIQTHECSGKEGECSRKVDSWRSWIHVKVSCVVDSWRSWMIRTGSYPSLDLILHTYTTKRCVDTHGGHV